MTPLGIVHSPVALGGLVVLVLGLLLVDLLLFARGRDPSFRESVAWSLGWLALGLLVALPMLALDGAEGAINYTTVYLIERSLSLDNLFVFLLIFGYFQVPHAARPKLLFWGIVLALAMRGLAIVVGVELIERFHVVIYVLGVLLLYLAWRILRGVGEEVDPGQSPVVRLVRRFFPVSEDYEGSHFFTHAPGHRAATPLLLALAAIVAADIAFAVDSIPAAFAITTDSFAIWAANAFALLGLRSLFALVAELVRRFRYLDETIAVVLATVAIKLLIDDVVHIGPGRQPRHRRRLLRGRHHRVRAGATVATRRAPPSAAPSATSSSRLLALELVDVLVGLELVLLDVLVVLVGGDGARGAAVVADLEALDELVARLLVDGHVVGEQHPVAAGSALVLEDVGVDRGAVVDHHEDPRVGVVVRPGPDQQVVELEAAQRGHWGHFYPLRRTAHKAPRSLQLALDLGLDVQRRLPAPRPPGVAGLHELADLRAQGRVGGDGRRRRSGGPARPRRRPRAARGATRRALRASSIWRTSSSRSRSAPAPDGGSAAGRSLPSRSDIPPRPTWSQTRPDPARATTATTAETATTTRITGSRASCTAPSSRAAAVRASRRAGARAAAVRAAPPGTPPRRALGAPARRTCPGGEAHRVYRRRPDGVPLLHPKID